MTSLIYALIDPTTDRVRYIGKTRSLQSRLATHIRDSRRRKTPVACWVRSLVERGATPDIIEIDRAQDWVAAERYWIARARQRVSGLLNLADGGDQPKQTADQRKAAGVASSASRIKAHAANPLRKRLWSYKQLIGSEIASARKSGNMTSAYIFRFKARCLAAFLKELAPWASTL